MGTDTHLTTDQGPLSLMSGMAMMLQSCNAEAELFDVTYWYLPQLFPDIAGRIFLMDDDQQRLKTVFHWGNFGDAATEPLPAACPSGTTAAPSASSAWKGRATMCPAFPGAWHSSPPNTSL